MPTTRLIAVLALALAVASVGPAPRPGAAAASRAFHVLVFTKTAGFRHASIPVATEAVRRLGARNSFGVESTEDAGVFTEARLARYRAVVFLLTTGDVLDPAQQAAFERFVRRGGGFVGVHSASDTEYDWPWYGRLVGAYFRAHPEIQRASVTVADARHPSTIDLPRRWQRRDEWYAFRSSPRGSVTVLATLDEGSYEPGESAMGADHPIAWFRRYDGGRSWYTAGGHTDESYAEPLFLGHLLGGIRWASGLDPPRIVGPTATVRDRRAVVAYRAACCRSCHATLQAAGRAVTATVAGGRPTRLTTAPLPRGRHTLTLVLRDRATGLKDRIRRTVTVR